MHFDLKIAFHIIISNLHVKKIYGIDVFSPLTIYNSALQSIAGITSERFSALVTGELQVEVRIACINNSVFRYLVNDEYRTYT